MRGTVLLTFALLLAPTFAMGQQRYTCESTNLLPGFERRLKLVLTVPNERVLDEARLTLSLTDRERRNPEHLSDPLRTALGSLSVQIGDAKPDRHQFIVLNYPSEALPFDVGNSLRGIAIDKRTNTAFSLALFGEKAKLEFVALDQLYAPVTLVRGRCSAA